MILLSLSPMANKALQLDSSSLLCSDSMYDCEHFIWIFFQGRDSNPGRLDHTVRDIGLYKSITYQLHVYYKLQSNCSTLFVVLKPSSILISLFSTFPDLLIVTVATKETDGYKRYMRSVKIYDLNAKVEHPIGAIGKWSLLKFDKHW